MASSNAVTSNTLTEIVKLSRSARNDDILVFVLVILASVGYLLRGIAWDKQDQYHHIWFERPQELGAAARQSKKRTRNIAQKLEEAVSTISSDSASGL